MRSFSLLLAALAFVAQVSGKVYFQEEFDGDWESRWVVSDWKKAEGTRGDWKLSASEWYGDKKKDEGLQTSQDARFYAISSKLSEPFSNQDKDLVVQFSVKFPQKIDCGGGYIKLLPWDVDQKNFNGDSKYFLMFGPDICGTSTKKTHVILNYKDENKLIKKNIPCETDQLTHVYTLLLRPDNSYEVYIDGNKKESGSLEEDWDLLLPRKIKDPLSVKPADWEDEATIDDPADQKPADWDSTPKQIPDPEAEKPSDWDEEEDGEWEAPLIDNPAYKGEWKAKKIPNPAYKGQWQQGEIDNPDFQEDPYLYKFEKIGAVGIELWQVKAGTLFDNIIITDNLEEAVELRKATYDVSKPIERSMFDKVEAEKKEAEEAKRKETEKKAKLARKAEEEEEDDDEEDEEDEGHDEL